MRSLHAGHDRKSGRLDFVPPPSDQVDAQVLSANTAARHTVPDGARYVLFAALGDFWAKFGDGTVTAVIPAGTVADGSAPEPNPAARQIPEGATHISLIATAATTVTLAFYGA